MTPLRYPVVEAYREFLFHGPDLHGIERIAGTSSDAFVGTASAGPAAGRMVPVPAAIRLGGRPARARRELPDDDPLDASPSTTPARCRASPAATGSTARAFPADPTTVVIRVRRDDGKFARADIDYLDPDGRVIAQMQDYECVMDKNLSQAFRRNQLVKK